MSVGLLGPLPVLGQIDFVAYCLDWPPDSKIHPVFHVSYLQKFHAAESAVPILPLAIVFLFLLPKQFWITKHGLAK